MAIQFRHKLGLMPSYMRAIKGPVKDCMTLRFEIDRHEFKAHTEHLCLQIQKTIPLRLYIYIFLFIFKNCFFYRYKKVKVVRVKQKLLICGGWFAVNLGVSLHMNQTVKKRQLVVAACSLLNVNISTFFVWVWPWCGSLIWSASVLKEFKTILQILS